MKKVKPHDLLPEITIADDTDLHEFADICVSIYGSGIVIRVPMRYMDNCGTTDGDAYLIIESRETDDEQTYLHILEHPSEVKEFIKGNATYGSGELLVNAEYISEQDLEAFKLHTAKEWADKSAKSEYDRYLLLKKKYEPEAPVIIVKPRKVYIKAKRK